jgi:AraC-like DNA-binding protein
VGFSLGGGSWVRVPGARTMVHRPGEGTVCDGRGSFRSRADAIQYDGRCEPALSVTIDWNATTFGSRSFGAPSSFRLSAIDPVRGAVLSLRRAIEDAWTRTGGSREMTEGVCDLLARLRAEGLEMPRIEPRDLESSVDAQLFATSRALDRALSRTEEMPMLVDVHDGMGVSSRTIQRMVPRVLAAWGQAPPDTRWGFRALKNRALLVRACTLMSHPEATTERVAEIVGFSTPNAFCRAFAERGLPSPGRVREELRALEAA